MAKKISIDYGEKDKQYDIKKIFIDYDEMEKKFNDLRHYGEIVDDDNVHEDGRFWHRKTMYLYEGKVWLISVFDGEIEYLLDVTALTKIEPKKEN